MVAESGLPAGRVHLRQSRARCATTTAPMLASGSSRTPSARGGTRDHPGVRDRPRRRAAVLAEAARGSRSASRCCRCSSTARWRSRRWRATPSGCASSIAEMQPEQHDDKAPHGPAAHEEPADAGASTRGRSVSSARSAPSASATIGVGGRIEGADQLEDAGDRHLGERHGDRRPRAASSRGGAARLAEHRPVRRLPGRRHARPQPGRRREERQDPRPDRAGPRRRSTRIESMSAHADSQRDHALAVAASRGRRARPSSSTASRRRWRRCGVDPDEAGLDDEDPGASARR